MERKLKAHAEAKSGFDKTVGENAVAAAKAHYDLLPTMFKAKMGAVDRILSGSSKDGKYFTTLSVWKLKALIFLNLQPKLCLMKQSNQ